MTMPKETLNSIDKKFLHLAIKVAEQSRGLCSPNPFVGAVIVKDGVVIAEGSTRAYGSDHAEIVALHKAGKLARNSTMYVTLEPCCHFGKTPPCTQAIIRAGVSRVVVGIKDPNPLVSGKGIAILKNAGIEVEHGFFQKEIEKQLEYFLCFTQKKRPFVIWKTALSLDGKYAAQDATSQWITNNRSRVVVHKLRAEVDAVLAGVQSVVTDDAMLNVRGIADAKQPIRVVLDPLLDILLMTKLVQTAKSFPTIVFHRTRNARKEDSLDRHQIELIRVDGKGDNLDIEAVLNHLYQRGISSILLETGDRLSSSFWASKLIDKCMIFYGNQILGGNRSSLSGLEIPTISSSIFISDITYRKLGDNILLSGYPVY